MAVGGVGYGELIIEQNGSVNSDTGEIGLAPDSVGEVLVDQGSWTLTDDLVVGIWGQGAMEVTHGGQVQSVRGWVGGVDPVLMGYDDDPFFEGLGTPDGIGTVLVTGENSHWDAGDSLVVGAWGTGTLTASEGGLVESDSLMIGAAPDATGTVTIDDAELAIAGSTVVGAWGQGNLTVSGGSEASVGTLYIGGFDEDEAPSEWAEAFGDSLGTNSLWMITGGGIGMEQSAVGKGR